MFSEAIQSHLNSAMKDLYTTLPGKVTRVYKQGKSTVVSVQPMINKVDTSGKVSLEPELDDVPIVWPSAGGCYFTLPIEAGDQVLLHFAMRSAISYKNSDGVDPQTPLTKRTHNVNDVFAVPSMLPYEVGTEVDSQAVRISSGATEIRIMKDGTIELGEGATERLIKGDTFLSQLIGHQHGYLDVSGNWQATTPTVTPTKVPPPIYGTITPPVPDTIVEWEDNLSDVSKTK